MNANIHFNDQWMFVWHLAVAVHFNCCQALDSGIHGDTSLHSNIDAERTSSASGL